MAAEAHLEYEAASMLPSAVTLERFRSFGGPTTLELRPITLLFGRNGGGKSALLRCLPLLADSLGNDRLDALNVEGCLKPFDLDFDSLRWKGLAETDERTIPKATLFDWARRRPNRESRGEKTEQVKAYAAMTAPQRHHYNLKEGFKRDGESDALLDAALGAGIAALYPSALRDPAGALWSGLHTQVAQDVWGHDPDRNPYEIPEEVLLSADFEAERARIFQSIFSML